MVLETLFIIVLILWLLTIILPRPLLAEPYSAGIEYLPIISILLLGMIVILPGLLRW